jgi:hypothetical protein
MSSKKMNKTGYVYVFSTKMYERKNIYKIGRSRNIKSD